MSNKGEYRKIGNCWNSDNDSELRNKLDEFYSSKSEIIKPNNKKTKKKKHKKVDHKHDYHDCLVLERYFLPNLNVNKKHYMLGKQCSICEKIKVTHWFITEYCDDGSYRQLESDEILEKYNDLPIVDYFEY
jgi:hypothetical protein